MQDSWSVQQLCLCDYVVSSSWYSHARS